jgi:hypothetical protein
MQLSQGHLSVLETCPRQFQHQILEQLSLEQFSLEQVSAQNLGGQDWGRDQERRLRSGSEFHQLVQQRSLSLPIEVLFTEESPLQIWFRALEQAEPDLFAPKFSAQAEASGIAESEQVRTLAAVGHHLVVVYDYVVLGSEQALILDWKTYGKPDRTQWIVESWQSRLYPYVLSHTSHYEPEHITMRYWFFKSDDTAQSLDLPYSSAQQEATERQLTALLTQLNQWLEDYTQDITPFPQTTQLDTCDRCAYALRCGRSTLNPMASSWRDGAMDWETIPEIPSG